MAAERREDASHWAALDAAPAFIAIARGEIIAHVNPTAARLLGVDDAASLRGAPLISLFDDGDAAAVRALPNQKKPARVALSRRGAGPAGDILLAATLLPDGVTVYAARDVSDVEHAATAIRTRERRLNKVLDTVNDAIIIAGADGAIERFNAAAERMFGWREGQAIGRNIADFVPSGRDAPMTFVDVFVRSAQAEAAGGLMEFEGRRRDGGTFPMEASIAAMLFEDRPTLVAVIRDLTERKAVEAKIRHAALHDGLTGLPNRLRFRQLVDEQLVALREGAGGGFAVAGVDLDRFRSINDLFGFPFGDRAIQEMAARLQAALGPDDVLARLTGDEFGILLRAPDSDDAVQALCDTLLQCRDAPVSIDGTDASISLRVGLVRMDPRDPPADAHAVIQRLETTLAAARQTDGGSGFCVYSPEIGRGRDESAHLELDLRNALERGELELAYQPKIRMQDGRVVGMEALMRWRRRRDDGSAEMISPGLFIPLAEETGLIGQIGEWALREACARTRAWATGARADLKCAVNLSPRQFRDARLSEKIREALDATGLSPANLELEITESGLIDGVDDVVKLMRAVKSDGVTIAIDDFGTGYSSLSYLKRLPIDVLKIDQSFMRGVPQDVNDVSIVRAVIGLAQALDLKLVAEGVETEAQAAFLQGQNCDIAQGYLFAKPLSGDEFQEFLQNTHA